jgi:hypothetical protein
LDLKDNKTLRVRKGDGENVINSSRFGTFGNYIGVPSLNECLWKKMIGKSRLAGFDEGELEIGFLVTTPVPHSTVKGELGPGHRFCK